MNDPQSLGRPPVLPGSFVQATSGRLGNDSGSTAEYALKRCRVLKGTFSLLLREMIVSELPEQPVTSRFLNGVKSLESRTVAASSSWLGTFWNTPAGSRQPAGAIDADVQAELEKMDERIQKDYQRICELHAQLCEVLETVRQTEVSLGKDIPFYDQALKSQRKDQEAIQVMANELLDEFGTLNESFLAEIQRRSQRRSQACDPNLPRAVFKVLSDQVRTLEDELRQKTLMIQAKGEEAHELDRKVQELTRQAEHNDKQMIQALTEQDRMRGVDKLVSTLKADLSKANRYISIFQSALDKLKDQKAEEAERADQLNFKLNQLTAQLRDQQKTEGPVSGPGPENIRLQTELQSPEASFRSAPDVLETLAALQHKNDQLETLTKKQTEDLNKIRDERDQARARAVVVEGQLKSHCAEMTKVMDETKNAEKGLNLLKTQIEQLQSQLDEERKRSGKLQADKLSSDTEVRRLRAQFASQVSDARIQASDANIQFHKELEEKKAEYEKETAHYRELSTQFKSLDLAMKKKSEKASGYFEKSQRLEQALRLGEERLTELESQKTQLEKQLKDTQTRLKGSNGRISALEVWLNQQKTELKQLRVTGTELKASKEKLNQVQTDLRQTRSLLKKTAMAEQSAREALQKKEGEVRAWVTESRQWNTAKATLEGQVETLQAGLRRHMEDKRKADKELAEQVKSLEVMAKKLLAAETKMKLASSQPQSDLSSQRQHIESLTAQVNELKLHKKKAEDALLSSEARFRKDYSRSEDRVSELTQQLIAVKAKLSNVSEAEQRAISEAAQAKSGYKKFESESVRLGQQVDTLSEEVRQLTDEKKKAKMQIEKERIELRSEVAMLREKASKADTIEQELKLKHKEISDQKAQLSRAERERRTQLEQLRQDLDESRQKFHEEEAAKLVFQLDYNAAKSQLEQLQQQHAEAMAEIDRLKALSENSGQAPRLGPGFDFRESGVEFDDEGAYVSLSSATHQPNSLAQPLSTSDEASLTDLQAHGPRGVSRFEYQDLMRKKNELEQQIPELREALRMAQDHEKEHKMRARQAAWEVGEIKKQLTELKAENEQFAHMASDWEEEEKKWREEVRKLTKAKAQIELDTQAELEEAREFAEKAGRRNAELGTEARHLRSRLEDLEFRLERDMPAVMQENQDLSQQNEVLRTAFLDVVGLFREKLSEADPDQQALEDRLLKMQAILLPPQQ